MSSHKSFSFVIIALISLLLMACKGNKKNTPEGNGVYEEVFARHQPRINDIRTFLAGLQTSLPVVDSTTVQPVLLSPTINISDNNEVNNCLLIQYHLLAHPETFTSYDSLFGLYYNTVAGEAFQWTGEQREQKMFERDFLPDEEVDKILAPLSVDRFPYLLITKPTAMPPIQLKEDNRFEGGGATASFYLYDLRSKKLIGSTSLLATPDAEMLIAYTAKGGTAAQRDAAAQKAKQSLQKNMRAKIYAWLKTLTGNTVVVPAY
jgi:hypothetical protein